MAQKANYPTGTRVRNSQAEPGQENWTMVVVDNSLRWLDDQTYARLYLDDQGIEMLPTAEYEEGPKIDGAEIVRNPRTGNVYLLANGMRYKTKNSQVMDKLRLRWEGVREVSDAEIDPVPEGPEIG